MLRSYRLTCRELIGTGLSVLLALSAGCTLPGTITPGGVPDRGGKTLMAIYMIGSDLEDDIRPRNRIPDELEQGTLVKDGHGSRDLLEMLKGYQSLPIWQRGNVDVLVAFGGARKQGWQGVTYADIETLIEDAQDGYFGNLEGRYLYQDRKANMGEAATFQHFLTTVRERSQTASVTMTSLWNHGASFGGLGPDTNHASRGYLALETMDRAFRASGLRPDLIGFDACLMASAEVIRALHPYAGYLVASEELEPGHGWDYTPIIEYLGRNAGPHPLNLGRAIVDSFITSPNHQKTSGKTLSVIDLAQAGPILLGIDQLAQGIQADMGAAYTPLLAATVKSGSFGQTRTAERRSEHSIDLADFAQHLKDRLPSVSVAAEAVSTAVRRAVVYNRTDGTVPQANGVSILSFYNQRRTYSPANAASDGWYRLMTEFAAYGLADATAPVILADARSERAGVAGTTMIIRDDKGLSEVAAIHAISDEAERYLEFIYTSSLDPAPNGKDLFFLPDWDGRALHVADGPLSDTNGLPIAVDREPSLGGQEQYAAMGVLNGRDVEVTLQWDPAAERVIRVWASAYGEDSEGNVVYDRSQLAIGPGDELSFYRLVIDSETGEVTYQPGQPIRFSQAPSWGKKRIKGRKGFFAYAADANDNVANSPIQWLSD